ncbi:Flp pilus assembly pilin Flp [Bradyrhizobium japonicum]|jgi:Flp pilus assembly pilin Flp
MAQIGEMGLFGRVLPRCNANSPRFQGRQVAEKRQPFIVIKLKGLNLLNLGLWFGIALALATYGRVERMRVVKLKCLLTEFAADESGATAIEYGLIAAGIALAIIEVIYALGTNLVAKLQSLATALK